MHIQILPGNLANMIAAGEVVQRPSSVVKELLENSIDAGATNISLNVQDAGRTLIQIIDDGCGMSPDDARLCFERHATSKLSSPEDLNRIMTFGFRGEALASIASVANVSLKTRRAEDELGCSLNVSGSVYSEMESISCPAGCNIAVRDLFFNVPARRKFLKSDNVEFKHIVAEFTHVAISRPDIAFTLNHNGKDIYVLKKVKSLIARVQNILGRLVSDNLLEMDSQTHIAQIKGFIGKPEAARKGLGDQYFFINGRYFRSPYLHKAVIKAYEDFIPEGVTPAYVIFLEMENGSFDVNVSPTKNEIKFEDESILFQTLYASVKEVLGRESGFCLDFESGELPELPAISSNFDKYRPISEPKISIDPSYNPFMNDGFPTSDLTDGGFVGGKPDGFDTVAFGEGNGFIGKVGFDESGSFGDTPFGGYSSQIDKSQNYGVLFDDRILSNPNAITLGNKYVLTSVRSGLMLINVKRARERVLFDRFLDALSRNQPVTQQALFPEPVEIGVENKLLLDEHIGLLNSLGFDIRAFGEDTVVINGVPEGYSAQQSKAQELLFQVIEALKENTSSLRETMVVAMAEKFARIGAVTADNISSPIQAQRLIDTLFACNNAEFTNSGRRIMVMISTEELDKKF